MTDQPPEGYTWQYGSAIKEQSDGTLWDFCTHEDLADAERAVKEWYSEGEETYVRDCVIVKRLIRVENWNEGWVEA